MKKTSWNKGIPMKEESKQKLRLFNLGKKLSKETRTKISLSNKGRLVSKETRKKISEAHKGKKRGPSWNKGLKGYMAGKNHHWYGINRSGKNSPVYITNRSKLKKSENKMLDSAYMEWAIKVKNRDNWKCKMANKDCKGRLEAHHILSWRNYPELRYEINNGITLCVKHHPRKYEDEKRLSPYFQEIISNIKLL